MHVASDRLRPASSNSEGETDMTRGSVTKLVKTFGSSWGRTQPLGETRQVFFNAASLHEGLDFESLNVGQSVDFDECLDQVNGSHAEQMTLTALVAGSEERA